MAIVNFFRSSATRFLLVFLILSQMSNSLLVFDLIDIREKIVLNNDFDNNSKEDKNNTDIMEESKILEEDNHSFFFFCESSSINYLVKNLIEVSNSKDSPPPEINS